MRTFFQRHRVSIVLFGLIFAVHGYFFNGAGWNQNARYDVVFSFVEPGFPESFSFRIDRFIQHENWNTGDFAEHEGHYYSNKAPGASFIAIPFYFAIYHGERAIGIDPFEVETAQFNAYFLNLWTSVFWTALSVVVLYSFMKWFWRESETSEQDAIISALVFGLATLMLPFSTQFWGHATASACIVIGLTQVFRGHSDGNVAITGFFLGLATSIEYLAGLLLPLIGLYLLIKRVGPRSILIYAAGASICLILLGFYHQACFGSFTTTAASLTNPSILSSEDTTLLGQSRYPTFGAFYGLLFSPNRGIFVFMPILIMSLLNAWSLHAKGLYSFLMVNLLGIAGMVLTLSCYVYWHAGHSTGSRYLIISLPFFALLLPQFSRLPFDMKLLYGALATVSFTNMLTIAAVTPSTGFEGKNVFRGHLYPQLVAGEFPVRMSPIHVIDMPTKADEALSTFNLGEVIFGLTGLPSLAPLLLLLLIGLSLLYRLAYRENRVAA